MALDRATKEQTVTSIQESLSTAKSMVVVHYKGLTVSEITDLRDKARENGVFIKVTKNSLARLAVENTPYKDLKDLFTGPTAIAFSVEDEVSPAKTVVKFSKKNENLIIIGGAFGDTVLDESGVRSMALMPSLDESRAKIVGILNAPASKLVCLLQTPAGQVARVIAAKPEDGTNSGKTEKQPKDEGKSEDEKESESGNESEGEESN